MFNSCRKNNTKVAMSNALKSVCVCACDAYIPAGRRYGWPFFLSSSFISVSFSHMVAKCLFSHLLFHFFLWLNFSFELFKSQLYFYNLKSGQLPPATGTPLFFTLDTHKTRISEKWNIQLGPIHMELFVGLSWYWPFYFLCGFLLRTFFEFFFCEGWSVILTFKASPRVCVVVVVFFKLMRDHCLFFRSSLFFFWKIEIIFWLVNWPGLMPSFLPCSLLLLLLLLPFWPHFIKTICYTLVGSLQFKSALKTNKSSSFFCHHFRRFVKFSSSPTLFWLSSGSAAERLSYFIVFRA